MFALSGCATAPHLLSINQCQLEGSYGVVGFYGKVIEKIYKDRADYLLTDLHVIYVIEPDFRRPDTISLGGVSVIATKSPISGRGRATALYKKIIPIAAEIHRNKGRVKVQDLTVSVPYEMLFKADHVGFAFVESGGRQIWPVGIELHGGMKKTTDLYSTCEGMSFDNKYPEIPGYEPVTSGSG